jgi:hypothetical protein
VIFLACTEAVLLPKKTAEDTEGAESRVEESLPVVASWEPCSESYPIRINEVLAANVQGIEDENGDAVDWVELWAEKKLDLEGWWLSEDGIPAWSFPAMAVQKDSAVLVFASGKDRKESTLHSSFSLDAMGGSVFLHAPEGCVVDFLNFDRMYADESLGRIESTPDSWEWFLEPTPGASNSTESRPGFAETPTISPEGGFTSHTHLVSAAGAGVLRCTLTGAAPTEESALCSELLADRLEPPVVVRARAFEEGLWPSRVATASFLEASLLDYGLKVISLVVDPVDLWDEETGIYVYGPDYEHQYPYFGANFWEEWEKDLHVEIWSPEGKMLVSQDAGIQIAGGYSRAFDQRNFELLARSGYGPDQFDSSLFPDESIESYRHLYLRNGGDWCSTQLVDGVVQRLFRDFSGVRYPSIDAQAYTPVLVYLNGKFWGLYELKERLDEWFIAGHHQEDPEALDRVKVGWTHEANWTLDQGSWDAFDALETLVATKDLSEAGAWAEFESQVDVVNFAASIAAQGWIGNSDWWWNNIRMWKPWREGGKWRWMVYDFGHGWTWWGYDHLATSVTTTLKGMPVGAALANPEFEKLFINVHADFLNTTLKGDYAASVVEALAAETRGAMPLQRERWCGGAGMDAWEAAVDYAKQFASKRAGFIDESLIRNFGLAGHAGLRLEAEPVEGGHFKLSAVEVESGFYGMYYQGVPVTVTAVPEKGWEFVGWEDGNGEVERVLVMEEGMEVVGEFRTTENAESAESEEGE